MAHGWIPVLAPVIDRLRFSSNNDGCSGEERSENPIFRLPDLSQEMTTSSPPQAISRSIASYRKIENDS